VSGSEGVTAGGADDRSDDLVHVALLVHRSP
jgi:hypothetical protein